MAWWRFFFFFFFFLQLIGPADGSQPSTLGIPPLIHIGDYHGSHIQHHTLSGSIVNMLLMARSICRAWYDRKGPASGISIFPATAPERDPDVKPLVTS